MKRSAVAILLSLFLGCLAYQLFIYYKPYFPAITAASSETWTVIFVCALISCLAVLVAFTLHPSSPRSKSAAQPRRPPAAQARRPPAAQVRRSPAAPTQKENELSRQLISLLNDDLQIAQWMLHLSQQQHPDQCAVWHLEQVIQTVKQHRATQPAAPLPQPPTHPQQQQPTTQPQQPHTLPLSKAEEVLFRQLVSLLHGNVDTANRLFHGSLENNPGKDLKWNLEKVTLDLVRDRGGKPTPPPVKRDYRDYRDC